MAASDPQKKKPRGGPKPPKATKAEFKPKRKPLESKQPQILPSAVEDDVPDFPRGGGSLLSRQDREGIRAEVDAEFEAEVRASKGKNGKRTQKNGRNAEDDLGSLFGDGVTGKLPRFANRITLKNVSPGMKLWGVITEINEKDLVISLPGSLRGLVRAADAFDHIGDVEENENNLLSSMFSVGQLVSSVVLQVDDDKKEKGRRRIWLSLRLSLLQKSFTIDSIQAGMVLSAYVKSIEDHGYILYFGLPSFTGFLAKSDQAGTGLKPLQLIQGVVKKVDNTRKVIYLNSDPDMVSKFVTKDIKGISIDLLVPGMMVNARVQSTLENGILLSFLTYFSGTVDIFHLQSSFPTKNWRDDYAKNNKVNARILFIDPSSRAVGLTLNQHLVHNKAPPLPVTVGDIYENSRIVRVDRAHGILLEIPSSPAVPAYVGVSDIAEEEAVKLEKKFREGNQIRARVLGFRHLEGLAVGVLKATAFEGSVFIHSDVKPGMVVRAKVVTVDTFGAIVQFPGGVKALCPLRHMSEFEIAKPRKKFKVGAELVFRVLGVKSKRITLTNKKTLVKSKLPIISSYTDATEGLITHGWITKIEKHGCFVRFYNGVQGFAPRHELGLQPGSDPSTMFHVEEVVKCRITGSVHAQRRISLSFLMKPSRISEDDLVKVGSIVSGVADSLSPRGVVVYLNAKGYSKGTIPAEHLSDHHEHAVLMKSLVKPGAEFEKLVVLDIEGNNLVLSAKYSLVNAVQKLPADISEIHPNLVVNGFICNLIENGCFVRFLGRLTGFSPRKKATDELKTDLSEVFFVGQSVRSDILDVDKDGGRITVSLKQSSCSSNDASFIEAYFHSEEQIYKLQLPKSDASTTEWFESFKIGGVVEGKIQETKDYGAVVSFDKYNDIFGFVTNYQSGGSSTQTGSTVRVAILDISKRERLVDLSMKPEFVNKITEESSKSQKEKKKRKREVVKSLNMHQTVTAVVEIVKEHYLVLSVPDYNSAVGFALKYDYNTQKFPQRQYVTGQRVDATVVALPDGSTNGRMLLLLKSVSENGETSSSKRAKRKSGVNVGSLVQAEITEIKPLEVRLKFGLGFHGRIPVTEISDESAVDSPFSVFKVGQTLTARIIAKSNSSDSKKNNNHWDLSVKPSIFRDTWETSENLTPGDFNYSAGQSVSGYVYKVDSDWAWITVSRNAKAQLHVLDSASKSVELQEFQNRFSVGKAVSGYILTANKEKKLLRIVLHQFKVPKSVDPLIQKSNEDMALHLHEGDILGGRISKVFPGVGGLVVQLGPSVSGRVHFAELTDSRVPDPLAGYKEGQFVKCKVIELNRTDRGTIHIDLSLRSEEKSANVRMERIADLRPDMPVQGYVKNVTSKGCFILLSRKLDARVLLSNLSDGYVKDPEKEFPVGKLVKGKVVSVEPLSNRVEVTLKTSKGTEPKSNTIDLSALHVGDIVSGKIKRVESFGLFITIGHSNLVGLCHISEIGEERVENIESQYRAGENVKAKILKIDEEKRRVSLGMKSSYLEDSDDIQMSSDRESDEKEDGSDDDMAVLTNDTMMAIDGENGGSTVLAQAESRASVPPLEVSLDEIEQPDEDNTVEPLQKDNGEAIVEEDDKSKKRAKKKAKEERERAIRAAEERLLEKDVPRTADEFEKLVRGSPNSSYVWIKYMAYMLDLADIEKARAIAERSLRTINIREENEKLNVWVAYFNLENKYGSPPEEAVQRVFDRALQYMDPKKVYLALLSVYERNDQHKLADDLLEKMTKKFKHSCKVWLRKVQRMMKQQQEGLQSVVNRALLCLPRHKHIKFISQTAILEYKCGVPDRGRSMFERVLLEYPKRTDLWSVYLDQEIRVDDTDMVRALFERAISLSLPLKKIKFLFKKYLVYEKSKGDEERVEYVKKKAMEYAETTQG